MKDREYILGILANIEGRISSLIQSEIVAVEGRNLFGQKISYSDYPGISVAGTSTLSGQRSCSIIKSSELEKNRDLLENLSNRHIPTVIHVYCIDEPGMRYPYQLGIPGLISWTSNDDQELIDKTIISHRIAELALCPVIHWFRSIEETEVEIPDNKLIYEFLGSNDALIDSPNKPQQTVFGDKRRAIPNHMDIVYPVSVGNSMNAEEEALKTASDMVFSHNQQLDIIQEALTEYQAITDRSLDIIDIINSGNSQSVISSGFRLVPDENLGVNIIHNSLLSPFPSEKLDEMAGKGLIGTLDSIFSFNGTNGFRNNRQGYYLKPGNNTLSQFIDKLNTHKSDIVFVDIPFSISNTENPNIKVLLQSYINDYEALSNNSVDFDNEIAGTDKPYPYWSEKTDIPLNKLSRFHNTSGWLYDQGLDISNPFKQYPVIPGRASWRNQTINTDKLPEIDTISCTGCGICSVECPFIALPSTSITIEDLLNYSIDRLNMENAGSVQNLTSQLKNISKSISRDIYNAKDAATEWKEIFYAGFNPILNLLNWDDDKKQLATKEWTSVCDYITTLPLSVTNTHFNVPESMNNGSGELFFLGVNPWNCTACGLCADACPESAITIAEQVSESLENKKDTYRQYRALPLLNDETLDRLSGKEDFNPLSALNMRRTLYESIDNVSGTEHFQLRKYLRLIYQVNTYLQDGRISQVRASIEQIISKLKARLDEKIAGAVSSTDYDSIKESLSTNSKSQVGLDELFKDKSSKLNRKELETEIEVLHLLEDFKGNLIAGPSGLGRPSCQLAISSSVVSELLKYPDNPFSAPVFISNSNSSAGEILGLIEGLKSNLKREVALLRKAELVSKGKYKAEVHDKKLRNIAIGDLTEQELFLAPPLFWFTDSIPGSSDIQLIIDASWPVRVVHLEDVSMDPRNSDNLLNNLYKFRDLVMWQTSMTNSKDFINKFSDIMKLKGAAMIWLPLSNPEFNQSQDYMYSSFLLNASRLSPEIWYNPTGENSVFSKLRIDNNPDYKSQFVQSDKGYRFTWADYALLVSKWKDHFTQVEPDESFTPLVDYFESKNGTPVITTRDGVTYKVSDKVVEISTWVAKNYLELLSLVNAEPENMKSNLLADLAKSYEEKLTGMKVEFEEKLKEEQATQVEKIREKLRSKLVDLTNRGRK